METARRLIHTFEGHFKSVTSLQQHKVFPQLFVSASLDGTARIWSLETFQHQYTFELPTALSYIALFAGGKRLMCGNN
jgi:WD40 repeat protein